MGKRAQKIGNESANTNADENEKDVKGDETEDAVEDAEGDENAVADESLERDENPDANKIAIVDRNPDSPWKLWLDFAVEKESGEQRVEEGMQQQQQEESGPSKGVVAGDKASVDSTRATATSIPTTDSKPTPTPTSKPDTNPNRADISKSNFKPKSQTGRITSTTPSSSSSSSSLRTVSLSTDNRTAPQLWRWFRQQTGCVEFSTTPTAAEDEEIAAKLADHAVGAEEDRRRVKKEMDKQKAQKDMLNAARREVGRMKEE